MYTFLYTRPLINAPCRHIPINPPYQLTPTHLPSKAWRTRFIVFNTPINPPYQLILSYRFSPPPSFPFTLSLFFFSLFVCPFLAGVAEAVHRIQDSGARVMMITGDSQDTATSIARSAGIYDPHRWVIVTNLILSQAAVTNSFTLSLTLALTLALQGRHLRPTQVIMS